MWQRKARNSISSHKAKSKQISLLSESDRSEILLNLIGAHPSACKRHVARWASRALRAATCIGLTSNLLRQTMLLRLAFPKDSGLLVKRIPGDSGLQIRGFPGVSEGFRGFPPLARRTSGSPRLGKRTILQTVKGVSSGRAEH